jgi:hypothetical protein
LETQTQKSLAIFFYSNECTTENEADKEQTYVRRPNPTRVVKKVEKYLVKAFDFTKRLDLLLTGAIGSNILRFSRPNFQILSIQTFLVQQFLSK